MIRLVSKLSRRFRCLDDLFGLNDFGSFELVNVTIYHRELILSRTDIEVTQANYLDLNLNCQNDFSVVNYLIKRSLQIWRYAIQYYSHKTTTATGSDGCFSFYISDHTRTSWYTIPHLTAPNSSTYGNHFAMEPGTGLVAGKPALRNPLSGA